MNSLIDGMATVGSPRETGLEFRKRVPSQRGEAAMRSRREFFESVAGMADPEVSEGDDACFNSTDNNLLYEPRDLSL
jgi:hypothetical protein